MAQETKGESGLRKYWIAVPLVLILVLTFLIVQSSYSNNISLQKPQVNQRTAQQDSQERSGVTEPTSNSGLTSGAVQTAKTMPADAASAKSPPVGTTSNNAAASVPAASDSTPAGGADITPAVSSQPADSTANDSLGNPEFIISEKAYDLLGQMTLEEKVHQLLFVTPEALTGVSRVVQAGPTTQRSLDAHPVGGIIYFKSNIQNKEQIAAMIKNSQAFSKTPLFIGVDEEGGRVARLSGRFFPAIESMKKIGESGDPGKAYDIGVRIAANISALGFNVAFAPVADVLTNPQNTAIGDRSFGSDPTLVADMVAQEVLGLQQNGVSAAVKHFPGHGDTIADTHNGYAESTRTPEQLRSVEFLPFTAGIDADVDFVMLSHVSVINADDSKLPASLSRKVVTEYLKHELGFAKIIITDSMSMGAVLNNYSPGEAAVLSLNAGTDMLLCPSSIDMTVKGILDAIQTSLLTEKRIDESVAKILQIKINRGIL